MSTRSAGVELRPDYREAVAAAIRAPSLHNSQPWRFRSRGDRLEVWLDAARRLPAADPSGWAARVAIGAAVFNLRLAVAVQGWQPVVRLLPDPAQPDLMAVVSPSHRHPVAPAQQRLWEAIWHRHSNRGRFLPDPVPADARARLVAAATAEGCWLELLIGLGPVTAVAAITQVSNQILMRDPAYRAELAHWTRSGEVADGIPAATGGPSSTPEDLLAVGPSYRPRTAGPDFELHPLVAALGTVADAPGDQLVAGQGLQRVLLSATADGLAVSMLSQAIEVASAREQLRLALQRSGPPQMVLRIGYGQPGTLTARRAVADVLEEADPQP